MKTHNLLFNNVKRIAAGACAYLIPVVILTIYFSGKSNRKCIPDAETPEMHSSVWCRENSDTSKLCKFKNVCYDSKLQTFLFFLANSTSVKGIRHYSELQAIQLSSIAEHNKFFANISVVIANEYKILDPEYVAKGFVLSRFKPDNVMHVFHDDLLPLFLTAEEITLQNLTSFENDYRLLMHDNHPKGAFFHLYELFSKQGIILLPQLESVMCFGELRMGLLRDTIFYQYGFKRVQGPADNPNLSLNDVSRFASYVRRKLNVGTDNSNKSRIVLASRKRSRRILNEGSLIEMLENAFARRNSRREIELVCLDLSENETTSFVRAVSGAFAFVAMHGAEMIFSIFLAPDSVVVELFPYAIQPDVVSFVKPLAEVPGPRFRYIAWRNRWKNNSVFHPDADAIHGGINFLPEEVRLRITRDVKDVPAVVCCDDPTYLYYMYQDTWVEAEFEGYLSETLRRSLEAGPERGSPAEDKWFFPSAIRNASCAHDSVYSYLNVSWKSPFNAKQGTAEYDVFFADALAGFNGNVVTENTNLEIALPPARGYGKFEVWIATVSKSNNAKSRDCYLECTRNS